VGENAWYMVGANRWYIVGENYWYIVGENTRYTFGANWWYIIAREVTGWRRRRRCLRGGTHQTPAWLLNLRIQRKGDCPSINASPLNRT
jgi:hypothetical protein